MSESSLGSMSRSVTPNSVAGGAQSPSSMEDDAVPNSLLNQAALVVAKHVSCEDIERYNEHLDEALLKKIAHLACPQDINLIKAIAKITHREDKIWQHGEDMVDEKKVKEMRQVGFMVTAQVGMYDVGFTFEKQQITSFTCDGCPNKLWCSHVIAAIIHRIENSDTVPVHAPVTETLSTLDRDQLQKLIQYAIDEDPAGLLGKIFKRIDDVRDARSEINETQGLPDPTFGIGPDATPTWELTVEELSSSFKIACQKAVNDFPCSLKESDIHNCWWYQRYMQRVIDLAQMGQIETAGKVLITLVIEATNIAMSQPSNVNKRYTYFLKTLEKLCSHYILEFTGQARSDLIILCQNLNRSLKVDSSYSIWSELPPISLWYPFCTASGSGIMDAEHKSMFYEPLCVSVVPDPPQDFYDLVEDKVLPGNSRYNEPLPLMILRFESLRLWDLDGDVPRKLLNLGTVILRKLLKATQYYTVMKQQTESDLKVESKKRRKTMDEVETGIPLKSMKSLPVKTDAGKHVADALKETITVETTCSGTEAMDCSSETDSDSTDDDRDIFISINDIMAGVPNNAMLKKLDEDGTIVASHLKLLLDPHAKSVPHDDTYVLPKETLSFCLGHICYQMYGIGDFNIDLSNASKEILALATLRSLELSSYRVESATRNEMSREDHSAVHAIEQSLYDYYKEHIDKLIPHTASAAQERLYMSKIRVCNIDGSCFFDNVIPLPLIAFLVKREKERLKTDESTVQILSMCLYTLCHSNKPFSYYEPVSYGDNYNEYCDMYRLWSKSYKEIIALFLDYLKDFPERNFYLVNLLSHYTNVQDGKALYHLWEKIKTLPRDGMSEDTLTEMLKFLLNCIKFHNANEGRTFKYSNYVFREMMESICNRLGSKFMDYVLQDWKELVLFFDSSHLTTMVAKMVTFITKESPVTGSMLGSIIDYFSGDFEHDASACLLLKLIENDKKSLDKVFQVIQQHSDKFVTSALLNVAEKSMDQLPSTPRRRQSNNVFTTYTSKMITIALKRIEEQNKSAAPDMSNYSNMGYNYTIFSKKPDPDIEWVFKAFRKGDAKTMLKCRQFSQMLSQIRETYAGDLPTMLSLLRTVEPQKPVFDHCKAIFSDSILDFFRKAVMKSLESITPRYYKSFRIDLDSVRNNMTKYVTNGKEEFKSLLRDIKKTNKSKKKLIIELQNVFDF